jgi:hypothetical protein
MILINVHLGMDLVEIAVQVQNVEMYGATSIDAH